MSSKHDKRLRRASRIRRRIQRLGIARLTVFRSPQHIYAQVIDAGSARVLAAASTLEPELRASLKHGGNIEAAKVVGRRIAEKAKAVGVTRVTFDRSGFKYHGRIKALADAAREAGLQF